MLENNSSLIKLENEKLKAENYDLINENKRLNKILETQQIMINEYKQREEQMKATIFQRAIQLHTFEKKFNIKVNWDVPEVNEQEDSECL